MTADIDACVCPPDFCVGVPGDSDTCAACLTLDSEAACLRERPIPPAMGACSECGHGVERHDPFGCWHVDCICRRTPKQVGGRG